MDSRRRIEIHVYYDCRILSGFFGRETVGIGGRLLSCISPSDGRITPTGAFPGHRASQPRLEAESHWDPFKKMKDAYMFHFMRFGRAGLEVAKCAWNSVATSEGLMISTGVPIENGITLRASGGFRSHRYRFAYLSSKTSMDARPRC